MSRQKSGEPESNENLHKIVWVDVVDGSANNLSLEVSFSSDNRKRKSDLQCVVDVLKVKRPSLCHALQKGNFNFESESSLRPGKWVSVGENSPVKNNSDLRCVITLSSSVHKPRHNNPTSSSICEKF